MGGAAVMVLRGRRRKFWKSWLALSVLVAVTAGFVLAAIAAGQRTAAAFPGFRARHGYDLIVYSLKPMPQLARDRHVTSVTPVTAPFTGQPACRPACTTPIDATNLLVNEVRPADLSRMTTLLSGRLPVQSRPDEVLASFTLAQHNGIRVGSVISVPVYPAVGAGRRRRCGTRPDPRPPGGGHRRRRRRVHRRRAAALRPVRHHRVRRRGQPARGHAVPVLPAAAARRGRPGRGQQRAGPGQHPGHQRPRRQRGRRPRVGQPAGHRLVRAGGTGCARRAGGDRAGHRPAGGHREHRPPGAGRAGPDPAPVRAGRSGAHRGDRRGRGCGRGRPGDRPLPADPGRRSPARRPLARLVCGFLRCC